MIEEDALALMGSLAHATRLRILKALVVAGPEGLTAGRISDAVGATPSRASFHLTKLAETGVITATRQAREIHYRMEFARMGALMRYLMEDCCQNNAMVRQCCLDGSSC